MSARFRAEDVFELTGRGLAVVGEVIEGTIRIGDYTQPFGATWPDGLRVEGIEFVLWGPDKRALLGELESGALLFEAMEVDDFGRLLPEDRVLVLRASPPTDVSS